MSFKEFREYISEKFNAGLEKTADSLRKFENKIVPIIKNHVGEKKLKAAKVATGALVVTLSGMLIALDIALPNKNKDNPTTNQPESSPVDTIPQDTSPKETDPIYEVPDQGPQEGDIYIDTYNGEYYYYCSQEYVYEVANKALDNCEKMLTAIDGVTDMGDNGFYQDFFNEDMLAAIAFTESTNRIKHVDGSPLESETGALGICQIEPITIRTVNKWLEETMTINDKKYTYNDANDPEKAFEIAVLACIRLLKNETRPGDENYINMGAEYSKDLQEKLIYAMYFYGEGNVRDACRDKSIWNTYLNPEWKDAKGRENYVFKVLRNKKYLLDQKQKAQLEEDSDSMEQ